MTATRTQQVMLPVGSFAGKKVLLVGDVIVDTYHVGSVLGLSAETPTIVAREDTIAMSLGGAGLVMRNIVALGGSVTFVTLVGSDAAASVVNRFSRAGSTLVAFQERGRVTTVKERFWANGYKLLGWDHLDNRPVGSVAERKVVSFVKKNLATHDVLAISDYRHGFLTERLARTLVALASRAGIPIIVDSQISQHEGNHRWYHGATTVCLNRREAKSVEPTFSDRTLRASLTKIRRTLGLKNVVVKLGEHGSAALLGVTFIKSKPFHVDARDTTGAGDAFFAVLALGVRPSEETLRVANAWAALSTTVIGTELPRTDALTSALSIRKSV